MGVIEPSSAAATRLATAPLGWLTTVRADGQPQSSYVWFHFDGDDLLMFSEPTAAKVRNLAVHPLVSFHLDGDGSAGGAVLTIEGTPLDYGKPEYRNPHFIARGRSAD